MLANRRLQRQPTARCSLKPYPKQASCCDRRSRIIFMHPFSCDCLWASFALLQSKPKSPEIAVTGHGAPILHTFDRWSSWSFQQLTKRARAEEESRAWSICILGPHNSHERGFEKLPAHTRMPPTKSHAAKLTTFVTTKTATLSPPYCRRTPTLPGLEPGWTG